MAILLNLVKSSPSSLAPFLNTLTVRASPSLTGLAGLTRVGLNPLFGLNWVKPGLN